jgi:methionyl-tRNA formyltransferase
MSDGPPKAIRPVSFALVTGHTFGRRALEGILSSTAWIDGSLRCAFTIELDQARRDRTVGFSSLDDLTDDHGIDRVVTIDGSLRSLEEMLVDAEPSYILVVGWSRLVAPEILDIPMRCWSSSSSARHMPHYGCVGMHPTLLPEGRGQAPIPWTIIKGLRETGLSVFQLENGPDAGSIIKQYPLTVDARETAASLFLRFADLHFHAGLDLAAAMAAQSVVGNNQDEVTATVWPRRRPADGRVTTSLSLDELDRHVRGLVGPYPRAFVEINGLPVRIVQTDNATEPCVGAEVGEVLQVDDRTITVCWRNGEGVRLRVDPRDWDALKQSVKAGELIAT